MRFISATRNIKFIESGAEYILNPVEYPHVNIHDILAGEDGYVYRIMKTCSNIQEARFEAQRIPGFPIKVTDLSCIRPGSKLLIMRVGGIGDMIMLTPILRYIKERIPEDVDMTLCTFKSNYELFRGDAVINNVISSPIRLSHLLEYDYFIEYVIEKDEDIFSKLNMTDYYFKLINVDYKSLKDDCKEPFLPEAVACAKDIIAVFDRLRFGPHKAIALSSLFSTSRIRDFPIEHFQELIRGFPDVLFVVPYKDPKDLKGGFEQIVNTNVFYLDTSRSLTAYMTAILFSDLVVSSDSSAYHIATALGKPSVVLFGSIDPALRVRYYPCVEPLSASYEGEFCKSPCGVSSEKWINLADRSGKEALKRNLYDPDWGCVEAVRNNTKYSPCLLAIPHEKLFKTFGEVLAKISSAQANQNISRVPPLNEVDGQKLRTVQEEQTPDKKKNDSISACMIVKNEEKLLPQCLESIKDVVDEIIIVDTGSTDRTVQIAEEFGAKVYHHAWEDNFSKHRNQSISYATGGWIFIIDADEELDTESAPTLRRAVQEASCPMIAVMVRSYIHKSDLTTGGLSVRLFKNGLGAHYTGLVHNQLKKTGKVQYSPIVLWHYGYDLGEDEMREKRKRSLKLLLQQAEMAPNDPITHHHLAVTYFAMHDWENALRSGQKTLELIGNDETEGISWTNFIVCFSLYKMGRTDEALAQTREGLEKFPKSIDLHHLMSCLTLDKKDFQSTLAHARKYFALKQQYERDPTDFGLDVFEMVQKEADVHMVSGYAHYFLGDKEKAMESFLDAKKTMRVKRKLKLSLIGKFYLSHRELESALHFFSAIGMDENFFDNNLLYVPQCFEKLERYDEAVTFYDTIQQSYPNEWEPVFQKGMYMLRRKDFKGAAKAFERAHELNPQHVSTLVNWGYALTLLGETSMAEEKYLLARRMDPDEPNANLNLGLLYYQRGDFGQSLQYLETALQDNPEHTYANLALSHVLVQDGEIERAVALCERLLLQLGLPADHKLETITDLGLLYYAMSKKLLLRMDLTSHGIANEIGHLLTPDDPKSSP